MMLHTKYQGSRPCRFRQKDLLHAFPVKAYLSSGLFGPKGPNLNKLGRSPQGDVHYLISRP